MAATRRKIVIPHAYIVTPSGDHFEIAPEDKLLGFSAWELNTTVRGIFGLFEYFEDGNRLFTVAYNNALGANDEPNKYASSMFHRKLNGVVLYCTPIWIQ